MAGGGRSSCVKVIGDLTGPLDRNIITQMCINTHHPCFVWSIDITVEMNNLLGSMHAGVSSTRTIYNDIAICDYR